MLQALSTLTLATLVILAVTCDLRTRRIPNALTVPGLFAALALRAVGAGPWMEGLTGAGAALAVSVPLMALGGLGGGDVKLLAAVGAFLGPMDLVRALLVMGLVGGAMALALVVRRGQLWETFSHCRDLVLQLLRRRKPTRTIHTPGAATIPYGVAIGLGALAVDFAGWLA